MKRICLFCEHFYFYTGEYGYSELTPGSDATIECNKQHWDSSDVLYEKGLFHVLQTAQTCKDYIRSKFAEELNAPE